MADIADIKYYIPSDDYVVYQRTNNKWEQITEHINYSFSFEYDITALIKLVGRKKLYTEKEYQQWLISQI
jgi:hypothetical protein